MLNRIGADFVDRSGLIGIEQCPFSLHNHRFFHRRQLEFDGVFGRNRGTDLDPSGSGGKTSLIDLYLINPVRQALHPQGALISGRQRSSVLIRFASDLNGRFHAKADGIGHLKVEFASIALGKQRGD